MKAWLLNYYVESNLGIILVVVGYLIFLRNEQHFQFKRLYLLGTLLFCLLLPLVNWDFEIYLLPSVKQVWQVYTLPEVTISSLAVSAQTSVHTQSGYSLSIWHIVLLVYVTGAGISLLLFTGRLYSLVCLLKHATLVHRYGPYQILETEASVASFSFFHYIILGKKAGLSPEDKQQIITHETAHARRYHSIDILFVELVKIIFWFNPALYLAKKILVTIHEYQADRQATGQLNAEQYCRLLARTALAPANSMLANHFNQSLTLKRIAMIKSVKRKMNVWKPAFLFAVLALGLSVVACQDQAMKEVMDTNKTISQVNEKEIPAELKAEVDKIKQKDPTARFTYIEGETKEISALVEKYGDSKKPLAILADPKKGTTGVLLQDMSNYAETMKDTKGVYAVVEDAASPVGGMGELMKFLQSNLQYPAEARSAKIQGKVFVQFIVQEDGSVTDVEVLKGIGAGCDEEAVRVVAATKWNPGKQKGVAVKQRMSIPIKFALDDTDNTPAGKNS